ncbi:26S proteasome regulatory subunit N5 [Senna tora]|uniref:26S proteasome regulatory subunit N5 n=1 Tax=Senna tora TaxID=362788 RepID=A0A834X2U0_9FABA|nr:26S proteasome regulatory subunit N5 [Senna tora]
MLTTSDAELTALSSSSIAVGDGDATEMDRPSPLLVRVLHLLVLNRRLGEEEGGGAKGSTNWGLSVLGEEILPQGRLVRRHADVVGVVARRVGEGADELREVEARLAAPEVQRRHVVGGGGHLRSLETAEPDPGLLSGFTDLRDPFSPFSLPDASVGGRGGGLGSVAIAGGAAAARRHVHANFSDGIKK